MPKKPSEKEKLIARIIRLQNDFIRRQRESGVSAREYYLPGDDDALKGYHEEHADLAARVVDLAHRERGSSR